MPTPEISRSSRWTLSSAGRTNQARLLVHATVRQPFAVGELFAHILKQSTFIRSTLEHYRPQQTATIRGLRGRPEETLNRQPAAGSRQMGPREEELFYAEGVIPSFAPDTDTAEPSNELFFLSLHTAFLAYRKGEEIEHSLLMQMSENLRPFASLLTPRHLTTTIPLLPQTLRFGFEIYQGRSFGSLFGGIPRVRGRCFLELTQTSVNLLITEQRMKSKHAEPLAELRLLQAVSQALGSNVPLTE